MAYTIQPGSILEVIIWGEQAGQTTLSLFHYMLTGPTSIPDGRAAAQGVLASFNSQTGVVGSYVNCCSNDFSLTNVSAQWIKSLRYARVDSTPFAGGGSVETPSLPPLTAAAITKRSFDQTGRHAHGTLHMPGVPSGGVVNGSLTPGQVLVYDDLCLQIAEPIQDAIGDPQYNPVIFQRGNPPESVRIDQAEVQPAVRTMRRRVVGRGI